MAEEKGIPTEISLKMDNEKLAEQLKETTAQLEAANAEIANIRAEEVLRVKADILSKSDFKEKDLERMGLDQLNLIRQSLERSGAPKAVGIKKSSDIRKTTDGRTVGAYDQATHTWVGG